MTLTEFLHFIQIQTLNTMLESQMCCKIPEQNIKITFLSFLWCLSTNNVWGYSISTVSFFCLFYVLPFLMICSHITFSFSSIPCFLKYPLLLRLMSLLPFLYLPKTWSSKCHIPEKRMKIALTSILTARYQWHIDFPVALIPKKYATLSLGH